MSICVAASRGRGDVSNRKGTKSGSCKGRFSSWTVGSKDKKGGRQGGREKSGCRLSSSSRKDKGVPRPARREREGLRTSGQDGKRD